MKTPKTLFLWYRKFIVILPQDFTEKKISYQTTKKLLAKSLIVPIVLILNGCGSNADIARIRDFSQLSSSANEELPKIANDIYLSCLRAARYKAISTLPPKPQSNLQRTNINGNDRLEARSKAQKECDGYARDLGPKMQQGNAILATYVQKLGELASDNLTNINPEFKQLQQSSGDLRVALGKQGLNFNSTQVAAGLDIFEFLTQGILDGKRVDTLKEVIPVSDRALQAYSDGLESVIKEVYISQYLRTEEAALDNYYKDYIRDLLASKARTEGDSTPALTDTLLSIDEKWNAQKDEIRKRKELASSYINLLKSIATSHQELAVVYGGGKIPSAQKVNKMLDKNTKALKDFVDKADKIPNKKY